MKVERSPADVLRLAVGVVVLAVLGVVQWLFGEAVVGFVSDVLVGADAVAPWFWTAVVVAVRVLSVVVLLFGVVATLARTGSRMLATVGLAVGIAVVCVAVAALLPEVDPGDAPVALDLDLGPVTALGFPTVIGIAATAAALSAAAPWLSRAWRRRGWIAVAGLVVARVLAAPMSFDSLGAALIGWTAGSAALVALGAPSRRPTVDAVRAGLAACGLRLAELRAADVDARGSTPYFGATDDGARYFVKVVGDDERSADLLFRLYRWFQRDDLGDERPFSSLRRAVEHEAFVALAARELGILTPRVASFASAEPHAFVIAYEAVEGRSLDSVDPEDVTDEVLSQVWANLAELHGARIAHRDLRLANVFLGGDGRVWMIDFGFSEVAASDLLLTTDVAELIASSSLVVGPDRAVAHAARTVDPERLAAARDRLRPSALSGATRTALAGRPGAIDELRSRMDAT